MFIRILSDPRGRVGVCESWMAKKKVINLKESLLHLFPWGAPIRYQCQYLEEKARIALGLGDTTALPGCE